MMGGHGSAPAVPVAQCPPCPACGAPLSVIVWGMPDGPPPDGAVAYGCVLPSDGDLPTHVCERCGWEGVPAGRVGPDDPGEAEREAAAAVAEALVAALADGSICTANWGDVYAQWAPDHPGTLVVELVANEFLPDDRQLDPFDERLAALGFAAPIEGRPNWHTWVADSAEAARVAGDVVRALAEVYRVDPEAVLREVLLASEA